MEVNNNIENLISVADYAGLQILKNRRGYPLSEGYIYRMIRQHKAKERATLPFQYVEMGQIIRIKR